MTPFISPRQRMCTAIAERLRSIRISNGHHTDAGLDVMLEPESVQAESGRAFIVVVWEKQTRAQDAAIARTHRLTEFAVIARVPVPHGGAQARLDAITADIERVMAAPGPPWPFGYSPPHYREASPLPSDFGSGYVGVTIGYDSHIPIVLPPTP